MGGQSRLCVSMVTAISFQLYRREGTSHEPDDVMTSQRDDVASGLMTLPRPPRIVASASHQAYGYVSVLDDALPLADDPGD